VTDCQTPTFRRAACSGSQIRISLGVLVEHARLHPEPAFSISAFRHFLVLDLRTKNTVHSAHRASDCNRASWAADQRIKGRIYSRSHRPARSLLSGFCCGSQRGFQSSAFSTAWLPISILTATTVVA
jgi:hypothetical protein